jgi:phosphoribosylformylglycinamidine synthase
MRAAIVTFPGSNCDYDAYHAVVDGRRRRADYVWHKSTDLGGADVVILPGGFSYGDYLRSGAIARFSPVMAAVAEHARRGAPVLAICNGFQIACEAGLLPGALLRNASLKYVCEHRHLRVENTDSRFTSGYERGQIVRIPIAHGEGRYVADDATLDRLEGEGRVVFPLRGRRGWIRRALEPQRLPARHRGHPQRAAQRARHDAAPERAVEPLIGSGDGLAVFESIVAAVAA